MKVLILSQFFHPENFRANELALLLKQENLEVEVLTGLPNYPQGSFYKGYSLLGPYSDQLKSLKIHRVPVIPRQSGKSWQLVLNYLSFVFLASVFGFWKLRNFKFDVIVVWNTSPITSFLPAILFKLWRKCPATIWVQDLWPETFKAVTGINNSLLDSALELVVRTVYRFCDQIWIQSMAFKNSVLLRSSDEKIFYVPNWADEVYEKSFATKTDELSRLLPLNSFVFAGNLGRVQSLETILNAAEKLRGQNLKIIFIGGGSLESWLKNEIVEKHLEENVLHIPLMPPEQVVGYLKEAKALFITLKKDPLFEKTMPSKLQSSLALGRPIVAAIDGEAQRVIKESGAGFSVAAEDSNALANVILQMNQMSQSELDQLGINGRKYYEIHFSRTKVLNTILQLIRKVSLER